MASNVADIWLYFGLAGTSGDSITVGGLGVSNQAVAIVGIRPIPSRCQVKQFGIIITTAWATAQTTDPIIKLQQLPALGAAVDLITSTFGPTNTKMVRYTLNPDVVGAGDPGKQLVGPSLGGFTTGITTTDINTIGTILLAKQSSEPTLVLEAGDALQVNVTTAGVGGAAGKFVAFVRLEVAGEQYGRSNTFFDNQ